MVALVKSSHHVSTHTNYFETTLTKKFPITFQEKYFSI